MATCGSLQHIFETPLPEKPTLLESLSWNQRKPLQSIEQSHHSFTEIFGELHFKETPLPSTHFSTSSEINKSPGFTIVTQNEHSGFSNITHIPSSSTTTQNHITNRQKSRDRFSSLSCESLQVCTEGLGFESSDEVEELKSGMSEDCWKSENVKSKNHESSENCNKKSRVNMGEYPPPISSIGRTGKPSVWFKSYRSDGRFVLKEIRIPTKEFLHACREDGRLKLHFVQPEEDDDDDDDVESIGEDEENDDCVSVNEEGIHVQFTSSKLRHQI